MFIQELKWKLSSLDFAALLEILYLVSCGKPWHVRKSCVEANTHDHSVSFMRVVLLDSETVVIAVNSDSKAKSTFINLTLLYQEPMASCS